MNNDRTNKKIINTKPDGVRSVGKPKMRWEDCVDQDIRLLGVKNWKKVALNRGDMGEASSEGQGPPGAVEPMMMMMMMMMMMIG